MITGDINLFSRKVKEKCHFFIIWCLSIGFPYLINPVNLVEDSIGRGPAEPVKGYDK